MSKRQHGFTLIELMVTLIVLAILVSLAAPNFTRQILNNRSQSLGEIVTNEVNSARYEAISRATNVSVCASSNGTSCTGNWTDGYIIFVDGAASSSAAAPIVTNVIRVSDKLDSKTVIDVKNNGSPVSFFRFNSLGMLAKVSNSVNPITIETQLTGCTGNNRFMITIGVSGSLTSAKTACI